MLERRSIRLPGWDCRAGNCDSRHPQGGQADGPPDGRHGHHAEEWEYAIVAEDGLTAISFTVNSGFYPPTVDRSNREPFGTDIALHPGFPVDRDELKNGSTGHPCDYVSTGRCYGLMTSSLQARELFDAHGSPSFEQPEAFWTALEKLFRKKDAQARAERVDLEYERCPSCDGLGTRRKP